MRFVGGFLAGLPAAMSSTVRPEITEAGSSSRMSGSASLRAASSLPLISSQFSRFSPRFAPMRTRCQRPLSFAPSSVKSSRPFFSPRTGSPSGSQRPRSQTITSPPPYWPFGISPSKSA